MDQKKFKKFVEDNPQLVSMKEYDEYPGLFVLRYKNRVFYDDLWNQYLEECRGTIVDRGFNIVSRPFTKIYNYGIDKKSPKLDSTTMVDYFRKVNGFMVAVTWHNDQLLISTTGSLISDFVQYARDIMNIPAFEKTCKENPTKTFMFECVHKEDPHIVPEAEGMYLLGYREKSWDNSRIEYEDLDAFAYSFDCFFMVKRRATIFDLLQFTKSAKHEGYVAYTDSGIAFKLKSPHYLVNKFFARANSVNKLLDADVKKRVDEEFYPLVEYVRENIDQFMVMPEQDRLEFTRDFLRKMV